jgi:exodeoxyribonuclease V alpha subunit
MGRPNFKKQQVAENLLAQTAFEGIVERFSYKSEDGQFFVARFATGDEKFSIKGALTGIRPGESIRIEGEWKDHATYGRSFEVSAAIPLSGGGKENGLQVYLQSGEVKGIGPVFAERIVKHFGEDALNILKDSPERLAEVPGISKKKALAVAEQWAEQSTRREVMLFLASHGLPIRLSTRLVRVYGNDAARIMRENPYQAAIDVPLVGFVRADAIASRMGIAPDSPQRLRAGLVHVVSSASDDGHTYLVREDLIVKAAEVLQIEGDAIPTALDRAIAEGLLKAVPLEDDATGIFTPALFRAESGVAKHITRLLRHAKPLLSGDIDAAIDQFAEHYKFTLAEQQRSALRAACAGGIVVVTGGPGTGKTTLVRALLHILRKADIAVALCSPTGRAAQRLAEATNQPAATLHRLLKFNAATGKFHHNSREPLEVDLLIVDETSMLDIPLASLLLQAVPNGATIIFVGDSDQLPSVGPGAFLKDLINSDRARTVRLEVIFRQAARSLIVQNSHRINRGLTPLTEPPEKGDPDFYFIPREEPIAAREALIDMVVDRIPAKYGFDPRRDIQVLTPMRRGVLGANELNEALRERINPKGSPIAQGAGLRVGDKVIQMQNNYDLDVFNGDVGLITGFDDEAQATRVVFGKRLVLYNFDALDALEPAYAITIHKSQGSEYPAVVIPVHTTHFVMLKRNLLYTGVTRGKKLVVLVGTQKAMQIAVHDSGDSERRTALKQWLVRPPDDESGELDL